MDEESIHFLVMLVEANPCVTLEELNSMLGEIFHTKPVVLKFNGYGGSSLR